MTKQEIIEQLKSLKSHCEDFRDGEDSVWAKDVEALDAAIEAMERQATSNYTSEWIPVSEGLPKEDYDTVLVFLESDIYDIAIWTSEHGFRPWYAAYFEESTPEWESKVLAWMPCPEPFKAGDNE